MLMVFAAQVAEGAKDASQCPALNDENRAKLNAITTQNLENTL